jgi:metal-dependent hydrolase (beta-lactamase superfamily II)
MGLSVAIERRENYLFDTEKLTRSFLNTQKKLFII